MLVLSAGRYIFSALTTQNSHDAADDQTCSVLPEFCSAASGGVGAGQQSWEWRGGTDSKNFCQPRGTSGDAEPETETLGGTGKGKHL